MVVGLAYIVRGGAVVSRIVYAYMHPISLLPEEAGNPTNINKITLMVDPFTRTVEIPAG